MEDLLLYFLQFNLYLIVLVLSYQFIIKKHAGFNFCRSYLLIGTILSIVLPFIKLESLNTVSTLSFIPQVLNEIVISDHSTISSPQINWLSIISVIYLIGCSFFFVKLLINIKSLYRLKQLCIKKETHYEIPNSIAAFSFMRWIFIGDKLSSTDKEIVLSHELIHVKKHHSFDLILCHLLEIVFWFNPLLFKLKHLFDEIHEYEADSFSCSDENEYIHLLLKQNFNHFNFQSIHQFNSTHLKQRIMRIKNNTKPKLKKGRLALALGLLMGLFILNQQINSAEIDSLNGLAKLSNLKKLSSLQGLSSIEKLSELESLSSLKNLSKPTKKGDVDKQAQFPGGQKELVQFMLDHVKYPKELKDKVVSGTVYVEFKIEKNGSISDYKILKRAVKDLDNASKELKNTSFELDKSRIELENVALEAMKKMPNWIPAEKDGKKVASKMVLPFKFVPKPPKSLKAPNPPTPPLPPLPPSPPSK